MVRESGGNSTLSRSLSLFVLYRLSFTWDFPDNAGRRCPNRGNVTDLVICQAVLYAEVSHLVISFIAAVHRTLQQDFPCRPDKHLIRLWRLGYRTP